MPNLIIKGCDYFVCKILPVEQIHLCLHVLPKNELVRGSYLTCFQLLPDVCQNIL